MSDRSAQQIKKSHGATRHCCYGVCNSDSRYSDRDYMTGVFWIPFPKPTKQKNVEKCKQWVRACGRESFKVENITRWTYICSKHFVGGNGPTHDHPDPIPATHTPIQVDKFSRKRKAPTPRRTPVSKRTLYEVSEAMLSLQDSPVPLFPNTSVESNHDPPESTSTTVQPEMCVQGEYFLARQVQDNSTQTSYTCSNILANKIERRIRQSNVEGLASNLPKAAQKFAYQNLSKNEKLFKFYTGITVQQFNHLFSCLGDSVNHLTYWRGNKTSTKANKVKNQMKISPQNQLLITLMKLRQKFPNKDLAYRFGVSQSTISVLINTWIQFLFKTTEVLRMKMFGSKLLIKEHLPACFKSFKNVRIIIDCFEIYVQSSRNFAEQGNMYSNYKNHATLKCLVGISPTGAITFVSDVYEGSISDKEIFVKSGLADLLEPGDLVIADRGFLIKDVLLSRKVDLNIPPFLCGRTKLTPQEEIQTKRIARVRIHVERAIERMKKYKIIGTTLPLSLKPVTSQIVHIVGFLVNYQAPLVK